MPCFSVAVLRARLDSQIWAALSTSGAAREALRLHLEQTLGRSVNLQGDGRGRSIAYAVAYGPTLVLEANGSVRVQGYDRSLAQQLIEEAGRMGAELAIAVDQQAIADLLNEIGYVESDDYEVDEVTGQTQRVLTVLA